jgi:hypothetical protein
METTQSCPVGNLLRYEREFVCCSEFLKKGVARCIANNSGPSPSRAKLAPTWTGNAHPVALTCRRRAAYQVFRLKTWPKVFRSQHFEARLMLFPSAPLLAAWLVLSVDNMKTSLSGREPLNGAAESGLDLLKIDVFDVAKSVRAKNCCHASRLETADRTFIDFLKLFDPLLF